VLARRPVAWMETQQVSDTREGTRRVHEEKRRHADEANQMSPVLEHGQGWFL